MILKFEYKGHSLDPWQFESSKFGKINLLVGSSGSGKSRFLNVLFNMSNAISHGSPFHIGGNWRGEFWADNSIYDWNLEVDNSDPQNIYISNETLSIKTKEGNIEQVVSRSKEEFIFLGQKLPRLQRNIPGISLLKEEQKIVPLHNIFTHVKRRLFHESGLRDALAYEDVPSAIIEKITLSKSMESIWKNEHSVSTIMYLLKNIYPDIYNIAIKSFMDIFPFVKECDVQLLSGPKISGSFKSIMAAFVVKEKGVAKWIQLSELSSGMQKVLLIISDILTLPNNSVYIIDEYENSLGVNAIGFLPDFLINHAKPDTQFFITTHHPYLINNMPINNWRIFRREGSSVSIKDGSEVVDKYGKSKQKAFIQLMNDPFYIGEDI